jgi:hypothetical protein
MSRRAVGALLEALTRLLRRRSRLSQTVVSRREGNAAPRVPSAAQIRATSAPTLRDLRRNRNTPHRPRLGATILGSRAALARLLGDAGRLRLAGRGHAPAAHDSSTRPAADAAVRRARPEPSRGSIFLHHVDVDLPAGQPPPPDQDRSAS